MTTLLPRLALKALAVLQVSAIVVLVGLGCALLAGILPSLVGYESFIVANRDMQPALQVGDLAVVGPVSANGLTVGDIVTYRTPGDPDTAITRRIVSSDAATAPGRLNLGTRGDSDPTTEQVTVGQHTVLGRLVYSVPRLGLLTGFANSVLGKIVLLGVPGLLLAVDLLRAHVRRRRRTTAEIDDVTRIQGLLDSGRRALSAGFPQLAAKAADGVIGLDPRNEAGALLKVQALEAWEVDREHVAA